MIVASKMTGSLTSERLNNLPNLSRTLSSHEIAYKLILEQVYSFTLALEEALCLDVKKWTKKHLIFALHWAHNCYQIGNDKLQSGSPITEELAAEVLQLGLLPWTINDIEINFDCLRNAPKLLIKALINNPSLPKPLYNDLMLVCTKSNVYKNIVKKILIEKSAGKNSSKLKNSECNLQNFYEKRLSFGLDTYKREPKMIHSFSLRKLKIAKRNDCYHRVLGELSQNFSKKMCNNLSTLELLLHVALLGSEERSSPSIVQQLVVKTILHCTGHKLVWCCDPKLLCKLSSLYPEFLDEHLSFILSSAKMLEPTYEYCVENPSEWKLCWRTSKDKEDFSVTKTWTVDRLRSHLMQLNISLTHSRQLLTNTSRAIKDIDPVLWNIIGWENN